MKPSFETLFTELKEDNQSTEPALKVGTSTAGVAGVLSLVQFFLPDLLGERQLTLILVISAFALPIITAAFTRGKVWSPKTVQELLDEASKRALEQKEIQEAKLREKPRLLRSPEKMSTEDIEHFTKKFDDK